MLRERRRDRFAGAAERLATAMRANRTAHVARLARHREVIVALAERADRAAFAIIDRRWSALEKAVGLLAALSYHGVLERGFALIRDGKGRPLRTANAVVPGSSLDIEFADGRVPALATGAGTSLPAMAVSRPRRRRPTRPHPGPGQSVRVVNAEMPERARRSGNQLIVSCG